VLFVSNLERFILDYMRRMPKPRLGVSVVDRPFHEAVRAAFPGLAVNSKAFGASPVPAAQRALANMVKEGVLTRERWGLGDGAWHDGFPKWVHQYSLICGLGEVCWHVHPCHRGDEC
jgi:hypothetical protein